MVDVLVSYHDKYCQAENLSHLLHKKSTVISKVFPKRNFYLSKISMGEKLWA